MQQLLLCFPQANRRRKLRRDSCCHNLNGYVVQGTAQFHHEIADTLLPQADPVFDDATALHTTVDMLDPEPARMEGLVGPLLLPCQFLASWLLGRHEDFHLRERERQEAQILQQPAPGR